MAKLYGSEDAGFRCPGEACPRFRSTKGKPPEVQRKIVDTCSRCRGNAPLEDTHDCESDDEEVTEMVARIERIARERDTCMKLDLTELDSLEFECLLVWDEAVTAHQRNHQIRIAHLFDWLMAQFQQKKPA